MTQEFYSNGKLLLSGEYAILDGAEGWAIPTKFGQNLRVIRNTSGILTWKSIDSDGTIWFQAKFNVADFTSISTTDEMISSRLVSILKETQKLQPEFMKTSGGYTVETELTFPRDWGLGTSSTLINNIAQWSKTNPYILLSKTFGGSGYDIACAQQDNPILFKIENKQPIVRNIDSGLPFSDHVYFVYLNQKKNSRDAIAAYRSQDIDKLALTTTITELTNNLYQATTLTEFERLLDLHECVISDALKIPTIKEQLFVDYTGSVKSLGGWGGDFIMVTKRENTLAYFKQKGFTTILPFSEMIL